MTAIRLGPFELTDRIGRGGMGEVWAARHKAGHHPVAIKVITDARALKERFQAAFRNEARAMAGMEHPGIARVHEFGLIDAAAAAASTFRTNTPYLVMERLDRPIEPTELAGDWTVFKQVLLDLLDALAHAHARGLVHRDLKPDNILWAPTSRRVKLTDFGVAHAMHGARPARSEDRGRDTTLQWEVAGAAESGMVGTPNFMAPEQVKGLIRSQGPWTDLYALGCLAFQVATGRAPFEQQHGGGPLSTMMAHLTTPVPRMQARMPVPSTFEGWVQRLLEKSPEARFRKAADAAFALESMSDPPVGARRFVIDSGRPTHVPRTTSSTFDGIELTGFDGTGFDGASFDRTMVDSRPPTFVEQGLLDTGPLPTVGVPTPGSLVPPMPDDWRPLDQGRPTPGIKGVGLGLFGLRRVPFVGRETERDLLWSMLRLVADQGQAQAVVLRGPAGFGKTRLAEWLLERADELGAANGLRAVHGTAEGPGQGLAGMLERALSCVAIEPHERIPQIRRMLTGLGGNSSGAAEALAEIIAPRVDPKGSTVGVRFARPAEHYAIILRLLERMAVERPVVVVLDDAQYSRRALDFCAHVLDAQSRRQSPILLVLTVRDEDVAHRPFAVDRLKALDQQDVVSLSIGPLAESDRPRMLDALLALDGELVRRIDERAGGNALFAVQLVGDWVQQGVLEQGEGGFTLAPGARITLPLDLAAVWQTRVERILEGRSAADARALELAAALGLNISGDEWRAVCAGAGLRADLSLIEDLLDAALARCGAEGPAVRWGFAHGMLREAILHRARAAKRLTLDHRVCARVLARRPGPRSSERVATHLLAAGQRTEAVPHLLDAARRRMDEGDYPMAGEHLGRWREVMEGLPDPDPQWGSGWLLSSRLARLRGQIDVAETTVRSALGGADRYRWTRLQPAALLEHGIIERHKGMFAEAEQIFRSAGRAAIDDLGLRASCSEELGVTLLRLGERERGVAALESARTAYAAVDDPQGLGRSLFGLARDHLQAGEFEQAQRYNDEARYAFESTGARGAVAACRIMDGELARGAGDLAAAADHYRAAHDLWESLGAANAVYARLNLGFTLVQADRYDEAWSLLESCLTEFERQGVRVAVAATRAGLLPVSAASGDWQAFDEHLDALRILLEARDLGDMDTARLTEKGARQAHLMGASARAAAAARLAIRLWAVLNRTDRIEALRALAAN